MKTQSSEQPPEAFELARITSGVRAGDSGSMLALYSTIQRIVRGRALGAELHQDCSDLCHESFIAAVQAIQEGRLREDVCLISYVHSIARHRISNRIEWLVRDRQTTDVMDAAHVHEAHNMANPERAAAAMERWRHTISFLKQLSDRDYEILHRFYVLQQSAESIQSTMELTSTQFRLAKSRARARIIAKMKRHENPNLAQRSINLARTKTNDVAVASIA